MKSKSILITGADGFIGSHLVEATVRRGARVRALCYYNSWGSFGWLSDLSDDVKKEVEIVTGDIRDPSQMMTICEGVDVVFHLAALIGIPYSYVAPDLYVQTNVQGTINLLNAVRRTQRAHVIQTSTSEVYGTAQFVPMTENHPLNPQSPYAASKVAADSFALAYHQSYDIPVTVVRPFNAFGPRQSTRAVIPTIISQLLTAERRVRIGALAPTRDFTFVTDTAAGFIAAAESQAAIGSVVQLGSNFEISVGEIISSAAAIIGVTPEIVEDPQRVRPKGSEVQRLFADNTRARELMSWEPRFGGREGFAKALGLTIQWYADRQRRGLLDVPSYAV